MRMTVTCQIQSSPFHRYRFSTVALPTQASIAPAEQLRPTAFSARHSYFRISIFLGIPDLAKFSTKCGCLVKIKISIF
jgi:hypothetical protein